MKSMKSKDRKSAAKSEVKTEKTIELAVIDEVFKKDDSIDRIEFASMRSNDMIEGEISADRSQLMDEIKKKKTKEIRQASFIGVTKQKDQSFKVSAPRVTSKSVIPEKRPAVQKIATSNK